ncbi:MAG: methyltransferase domain-containing protein, partial [Pseudomonadota bacterium]
MVDKTPSSTGCPLCGGSDLRDVFQLRSVPVVCNQLWPNAQEARGAAVCDMDLGFCPQCSLVANRTFDPDLISYAPGYENALHFSPKFQSFARELCSGLIERHALSGRDVVEIGCGDGHILDLMVKSGARSATGFDPSMEGKHSLFAETPGVEIVPEYFRAEQLDRPFDILMCRHVLEHLP